MIKEKGLLRSIYLFIAFTTLVMLLYVVYNEWQRLKHENFQYLSNVNQVRATGLSGELDHLSSLLRIIGGKLLKELKQGNRQEAQLLIDTLLQENSQLAGFGLAAPDGNLVLTSSNLRIPGKTINLLKLKGSADSFRYSLKHDGLLLGRSYYFKRLKRWIIPLRYTLRDKTGKVQAVMTTGIDIDSSDNAWGNKEGLKDINFIIVRENYFIQYMSDNSAFIQRQQKQTDISQKSNSPHPELLQPYPPHYITRFEQVLKQQTGLLISDLKRTEKLIQIKAPNLNKRPLLTTIQFNPRYKLFFVTTRYQSYVVNSLIGRMVPVTVIIILFNVILFLLFRYLEHAQSEQRKELQHQAHFDALTGLPNRYYLYEEFSGWANSCNNNFFVLFLDLDNFKDINDTHGHTVGDSVLREVSRRIEHQLDNESIAIRQGGDEFILFCPGTQPDDITEFAGRLMDKIREPLQEQKHEFSITSSIGMVQSPDHGTELDDLLSKADMAMYEAKRHRNRLMAFNNALEVAGRRRVQLEKELRLGEEKNDFYLVYQPQISATSNLVIGLEALMRWNSPSLGPISPGEFIPIAESTGLIQELSGFVFRKGLTDLEHIHQLNPEITLSVNISPELLDSGYLQKNIQQLLQVCNVNPANLMLEVTESLFINNVNAASTQLQQLREHGIKISLDDFGTGYSSLSLLTSLPIDELKIDASFVRDILLDNKDRHLVENIIAIGHNLDLVTLAEGVETQQQVEILKELKCQIFQGYYFAKPMVLEDLLDYLRNHS